MSATITITPLPARSELAEQWRALEQRAHPNFFLSWLWIETWLDTSGATPLLLNAQQGAQTIGLALLTPHMVRRHVIVRARQLCLHETGDPIMDRLTIEHNGFLLDPAADQNLPHQLFEHLQQHPEWDELLLGGVPQNLAKAAQSAGLHIERDRQHTNFVVSLTMPEKDWLTSLSRNTRSQMQQAIRHAEQFGPLKLTAAQNAQEAYSFFEEMAALHEDRWKAAQNGGAFSSEKIRSFHHTLIARGIQNGSVALLRATAGPQLLGYLYNFSAHGTIYNYQSGFLKLPDNRHRPGLVTHRLCIDQARKNGFVKYDLLAGSMRYKQSLGQAETDFLWCRAQKTGLVLALERTARGAKHRLAPRRV